MSGAAIDSVGTALSTNGAEGAWSVVVEGSASDITCFGLFVAGGCSPTEELKENTIVMILWKCQRDLEYKLTRMHMKNNRRPR